MIYMKEYILNLMESPEVTTYELTENYRNAPEILQYAKNGIRTLGRDYEDYSTPMRTTHGRVIDVPYSGEGIATTIERYVSRGDCDYKDWFILNYNRPGFTIEVGLGTNPIPIRVIPYQIYEMRINNENTARPFH